MTGIKYAENVWTKQKVINQTQGEKKREGTDGHLSLHT
jgi:hypothetical protein